MAGFDRFERLLRLLADGSSWPEAVAGLDGFDLVSLHVSPGEAGDPALWLTFESILPMTAADPNAVTFTVVFHGVRDLAITRWGSLDSYAAQPRRPGGGWQAELRGAGAGAGVGFGFASIGVDGVRYFRAGGP